MNIKKPLTYIKVKLGLLGAVASAAVVGGMTTGMVMAAIPDSSGQINACYGNSSKALKVTDPAGNCGSTETALSWDQAGWKGYGYIKSDDTLNSSISKNITSVTVSTVNASAYCVDTSFTPSLISTTSASTDRIAMVRGAEPATDAQINQDCGTTTEAEIWGAGQNGQVYFFLR